MPPKPGAAPTPGRFQTIVGCNDCRGGSLRYPSYLQTWHDDGTTLTLQRNATIRFAGTPAAYSADTGCPGSYAPPPPPGADQAQSEGTSQMCGLRTPSQSIIRTTDGNLLMAFYGHAASKEMLCAGGKQVCMSLAFYTSADDGLSWVYASRVERTAAMPTLSVGIGEPSIVSRHDIAGIWVAFFSRCQR